MKKITTKVRYLFCISLLLVCGTATAQTNVVSPQSGLVTSETFDSNTGNFGTNDFTVELWMNTSNVQNAVLVGKREICNLGPGWNIMIGYINGASYPGNVGFEVLAPDADYSAAVTEINVTDGQWHHLALTRAGTVASIFVDGVIMASLTIPADTDLNNSAPLLLGRTVCEGAADIQPFQGQLAGLAIHDRALTPAEILSIYTNGGSNGFGPRHDSRTLRHIRAWRERNNRLSHRRLPPNP